MLHYAGTARIAGDLGISTMCRSAFWLKPTSTVSFCITPDFMVQMLSCSSTNDGWEDINAPLTDGVEAKAGKAQPLVRMTAIKLTINFMGPTEVHRGGGIETH